MMENVHLVLKTVKLVLIQALVMLVNKDILIKFKMVKTSVLKSVWEDKVISYYQTVRKPDALQVVPHVLKVKCLVNNVLKVTFSKEKNVLNVAIIVKHVTLTFLMLVKHAK